VVVGQILLGVEGHPISGRIYIHHMNPISLSDIENKTDFLLNTDFLICVSKDTHDAIHYGADHVFTRNEIIERKPFDTCLWRT
jgi:predicted HNH restriction endonuclease